MAMSASRFATIVLLLMALQCHSSQITNINDILDIPLSSNVFTHVTAQDGTTPDRAFLGCIRAFFLGNATDVKFHFTDNLWEASTLCADFWRCGFHIAQCRAENLRSASRK